MSLAAAVLLVALSSTSMAAAPWTAVARVASEEEASLLERVKGQSSDLSVKLEPSPGASLAVTPASQWREVERLAASHDARAVLWFAREGQMVRVLVAELDGRHLFTREARLGEVPGSLEWSAGAEALALAARSALRAVEAGAPLGVVVPQAPRVDAVPAARPFAEVPTGRPGTKSPTASPGASGREVVTTAPDRHAVETEAPRPTGHAVPLNRAPGTPVAAAPGRGWLAVGGHAALDGYTRAGHQGVSLGAGWQSGRVRLRLQLLAGLPARLRDARTEVSLGQHGASVGAGWPWAIAPLVEVEAGVGAGVVGFRRSTLALSPDVAAAPTATMFALLTGPELRARWRMAARVGVEAAVSAEVLLGRPELRYVIDGNFVSRGDGWAVRPRLQVALVVFP
ncbi:hypothetical protein [Comamonas sp. JC664]|uniref:hypothetical protein n=1 Tax=Comamonas sp. JC664 TaxID=2801917 RepID=UPI00174D3AA9|nr:hypothetical protein [Comamonas sp. JC664]MBL0693431.1 hypothetical protein [Comamonas sp. JC664]GHG72458.1 hypothetical protein GCM10012319_18460 [Comamonas sp. KCTC 72670]